VQPALPVHNERGEALVALHAAQADALQRFAITFAVTVCTAPGGYLLVHNHWRKVWELPGGLLDPGETPAQCAAREFREETSQVASHLHLRLIAEIEVLATASKPAQRFFGAVFTAEVGTLTTFLGDPDIDAMQVFGPQALPERLSAIDAALLVTCST
jgi:8-oxo-dGTP diphosphatase